MLKDNIKKARLDAGLTQLEVAEKLCDTVSIINSGKLIASGTMEEIKGQHSLEDVFMEVVENGKEI